MHSLHFLVKMNFPKKMLLRNLLTTLILKLKSHWKKSLNRLQKQRNLPRKLKKSLLKNPLKIPSITCLKSLLKQKITLN